MSNKYTFFLRFYGTSEADIERCIAEMSMKGLDRHVSSPLKLSMNLFLITDNNTEVDLYFDTEEEMQAARNSVGVHAIYMKYAAPCEGCEFVDRALGDSVYVHDI